MEGIVERGNEVKIMLRGEHVVVGVLKEDTKGYVVTSDPSSTAWYLPVSSAVYLDIDAIVAIEEFFPQGEENEQD
jgi:hypothetical protein